MLHKWSISHTKIVQWNLEPYSKNYRSCFLHSLYINKEIIDTEAILDFPLTKPDLNCVILTCWDISKKCYRNSTYKLNEIHTFLKYAVQATEFWANICSTCCSVKSLFSNCHQFTCTSFIQQFPSSRVHSLLAKCCTMHIHTFCQPF
jgi:hypothetical protein